MAVVAYVFFNGNCREALEFYAEVFETDKPEIAYYSEAPSDTGMPMNEETKNMVMHATLEIKGSTVMFSDVPPEMKVDIGDNINLVILSDDTNEIEKMYNKLKEDGTVVQDLQETFWTKCYGIVIDKFGVNWHFSFEDK